MPSSQYDASYSDKFARIETDVQYWQGLAEAASGIELIRRSHVNLLYESTYEIASASMDLILRLCQIIAVKVCHNLE